MADPMQKPVVLITGSSGLIGTKVIEQLEADYATVGLDIKPPESEVKPQRFFHCDLTEEESVAEAIGKTAEAFGNKFASVVHLAAYYDFSGEPSPLYQAITVEGTRRLLRALRGYHPEQFVFSSSLLVMKPVELGDKLTEDSETQAEWEYPQSKLDTEAVLREERGPIPTVICRIAGVYSDDCNSIPIAQQIRRIYEKDFESLFFPGNAQCGQSFVHVDDAVQCLRLVVDTREKLAEEEVFLVGESDVVSYGELQEIIGEQIHGQAWPTIRVPKAMAKAGAWVEEKLSSEENEPFIKPWMVDLADAHYPVDNSRARAELGWEPQHSLRGTLKEMLERLKEDPAGWYERNGLPLPDSEE